MDPIRRAARHLCFGIVLFAACLHSAAADEPDRPAPIHPSADGTLRLPSSAAKLSGPSVRRNLKTDVAAWWSGVKDRAEWTVEGARPGRYEVFLTWGVPDKDAAQPFVIELDGTPALSDAVPSTGGYADFEYRKFGEIELGAATHRLAFRPAADVRHDLLDLRSVTLVPAGQSGFRIAPIEAPVGFEVELAVRPPLVRHPMMACLDDRGRLFLVRVRRDQSRRRPSYSKTSAAQAS